MKQCHLITSTSFSAQKGFENLLIELFNLTKINIRDLLTKKLREDQKSNLAVNIKKYIESGQLVPTKLINQLIQEKIASVENGLLIIGYPRTKEHLDHLIILLNENQFEINQLWILELSNIEKLIENKDQTLRLEMTQKFQQTKTRNKELTELLNDLNIITKIEFEYPMEWDNEKTRKKVRDVYNTIYSK